MKTPSIIVIVVSVVAFFVAIVLLVPSLNTQDETTNLKKTLMTSLQQKLLIKSDIDRLEKSLKENRLRLSKNKRILKKRSALLESHKPGDLVVIDSKEYTWEQIAEDAFLRIDESQNLQEDVRKKERDLVRLRAEYNQLLIQIEEEGIKLRTGRTKEELLEAPQKIKEFLEKTTPLDQPTSATN